MRLLLAEIEWSQGVEDAWRSVAAFVPDFLGFCLILGVGWVVARTVSRVLDRVLERSGFDRAVERGGIRSWLARSRYDASDIVSRLVFYGLMLLVLQLAFGVFGANPISSLLAGVIAFLPRLFVAMVIVVVAAAIAAAVRDIVVNALSGLSYGRAMGTAASASIIGIGAFMALNQLQIAPAIVNGLFYAVLAVAAGSAIVAVGGGGIQPMRARWDRALARWDEESPRVRREIESSRTQREIDLRDRARSMVDGVGDGAGAGAGDGADSGAGAGLGASDDDTLVASVPSTGSGSRAARPMSSPGARPSSPRGGSSGRGADRTTQDRIRAEIRSERDTMP